MPTDATEGALKITVLGEVVDNLVKQQSQLEVATEIIRRRNQIEGSRISMNQAHPVPIFPLGLIEHPPRGVPAHHLPAPIQQWTEGPPGAASYVQRGPRPKSVFA